MAKCTGVRCPMQVGYKIDECNHTDCPYRTEPVTNADKIRAMNDEELAKVMERMLGCPVTGDCKKMLEDCNDCWLDWLQQPAKGE